MAKEIKSFGFEFTTKAEGDVIRIEGYGSTFGNVDQGGDVVQRGAFVKSLESRMPKMFWQHDAKQIPGVWEKAAEDTKGLYLDGYFLNTTLGRDVAEQAKHGAIDSMSIGYGVKKAEFSADKKTRMLKELNLFEVSLVTFPMNELATITAVKSLPETVREFEEFLRDAGYSKAEATAIASRGFKQVDAQRDADADAIIQSLNSLLTKIKG